jgi:hypothetical protein
MVLIRVPDQQGFVSTVVAIVTAGTIIESIALL